MSQVSGSVELRYLIICEESSIRTSNQSNEIKVMIIQPIMELAVPFLPTQIVFHVAAGLVLHEFRETEISYTLYSPDKNVIFHNSEILSPPVVEDSNCLTTAICFGLKNVIIRSEGEYVLKLHSKEAYLGEQKFRVVIKQEIA